MFVPFAILGLLHVLVGGTAAPAKVLFGDVTWILLR